SSQRARVPSHPSPGEQRYTRIHPWREHPASCWACKQSTDFSSGSNASLGGTDKASCTAKTGTEEGDEGTHPTPAQPNECRLEAACARFSRLTGRDHEHLCRVGAAC